MTVVETGKFGKTGVLRGYPPSGYDMDNDCNTVRGGGYRGIGMVEFIWKICAYIMNNQINSFVTLKHSLHGFRQGIGAGTATLESNLAQKLAGMFHDTLFQVFLNMRKSYYSLYRGSFMYILRGYGLGPKLKRLLHRFVD